MFYLDHHASTRDMFMRVFSHYKTSVCTNFDSRKHVYV